nr:hypothetical protein - Escherichia coli [Escherichia coli]
ALQKVENFRKPMLWDADALNLLAINPDKRHNRVITPHPGEAARLLGCSVAEIESDRLHCAKRLVQRYADVLAARFGTRGMLATDLFSTLQRIVNPEVTDKNHDESSNSAP